MIVLKFYENINLTNDLIDLSKLILKSILENTLYKKNIKVSSISEFEPFTLSEVKGVDSNYHNFIYGNFGQNLHIFFVNTDKDTDGFTSDSNGRYVYDIENKIANIHLKCNNLTYESYNRLISRDDAFGIIEYHFLKDFLKTFIHELTHAYDDFRSNFKLKKFNEPSNYSDAEGYKKYLNYNYEIHARFNALIYDISFYDTDIDEENDCFVDTLKDFPKCLTQFKNRINSGRYAFDLFTQLNRKKILSKFAKYYLSLPKQKIG